MKVRVRLAALLHGYTGGRSSVEAEIAADGESAAGAATTVGAVMDALERSHPGIAFRVIDEQGRVRRHVNVFVGEERATDRASVVPAGAEVYIVGALSGG
jgi:molybdopterin converting factor small subunit